MFFIFQLFSKTAEGLWLKLYTGLPYDSMSDLYKIGSLTCIVHLNQIFWYLRDIGKGIGGGSRVKIEILNDSRNSTFNLSESFYRM